MSCLVFSICVSVLVLWCVVLCWRYSCLVDGVRQWCCGVYVYVYVSRVILIMVCGVDVFCCVVVLRCFVVVRCDVCECLICCVCFVCLLYVFALFVVLLCVFCFVCGVVLLYFVLLCGVC